MREEIIKQTIFNKEKYKSQLEYWLKVIEHEFKPMELPLDLNRDNKTGKVTDSIKVTLPKELFEKLFDFCKESDLTLYIYLLAVFKAFLCRMTLDEEILICSPLLKLEVPGSDPGEYLKYNKRILLRDEVNTGITFKELLIKTKDKTLGAYRNQNYPLDLVFKEKGLDINEQVFLDRVIFLLENLHDKKDIVELEYDLLFSLSREKPDLHLEIDYNKGLFNKETLEGFARIYIKILQQCIQDINVKLKDLALLTKQEVNRLLYEFNSLHQDYPEKKTIHQLFEEQAEKTPDRTAVVGESIYRGICHLSYRELKERSSRLAALLRKKGIGPDCIVGLMLEPCLEMVIGILAILEAGGAYLPIDARSPWKRIDSLLSDSRLTVLLTKEELIRQLSFITLKNLNVTGIKAFVTPPRELVDHLDGLQKPDRSYVNYEKYSPYIGQSMIKNSMTFHFSRGCLYKCAYCFKIWPNNRYVHRSAENMFEELHFYYKMGLRKFSFVDDLPNFNIKESMKFYQLIVKNHLKVQLFYPNGLRGDILTQEYIDIMVEAGTVSLDVALETTSRRLQKLIGKNLNLERLHKNIIYMIETYPQLILETQLLHGIPTETEEEAQHSLEYLKSLKWIQMPYLHVLKIYPNTDMASLAMKHGVSREAIEASDNLGYNELPETLPFPKSFTHKYQSEFASEYFLLKDRLLAVLPYQMKALSQDELVQKYDSFLPVKINCFSDLLNYVGISRDEIKGDFLADDYGHVPHLNLKIKEQFFHPQPEADALKVLLIDISAYFTHDRHHVIYDVVEPPLGLMYLQTHLDRVFGRKIQGKIVASRIDFDSFKELRTIIHDFKPDVIGIRTMNFYKEFFHTTVSLIRQWGISVPIVAGGPYATSSYETMLKDTHIDLAVRGEGEITFAQLIGKIIENKGTLPPENDLKNIPGIAFIESKNKSILKLWNREILMIDNLEETITADPVEKPQPVNKSNNLAYIIYTSGSTGVAKGVLIRHNNLVNQVTGLVKRFGLDVSYHYLLLAAFTFDVSVMHIFLPLITGAKLFLIPDEVKKDTLKLWRFIQDKQIDLLNIVPAFMKALLDNMEKKKISFRYLFVGGDVFDHELYKNLKETFKVGKIINIYGPTETTINAALYECEPGKIDKYTRIPIGKPLTNYRFYILDKNLNLVPVGVGGELCISGPGVARGYLNWPELTFEKFYLRRPGGALLEGTGKDPMLLAYHHLHQYPITPLPYYPIYMTGDQARWLPDGNIEFLGRLDLQVKIRGFRIEPAEIEKQLLKHKEIKNAVVLVKHDTGGEKYLHAYVVSPLDNLEESELKKFLSEKLPEYMIPTFFIKLKKIPLTPSGKVDKSALPDHETRLSSTYAAPRDEREKALVGLWADVVGADKNTIGIDSDFFELGGHSLKATILIARIHKTLEVKIPMVELFRNPTIRGLSQYLRETEKEKHTAIEASEKKEYYPVSSGQKRLYLIQHMDLKGTTYNMPEMYISEDDINKDKLMGTFKKLIERHESLRTSFEFAGGQPIQYIHDHVEFELEYYDLEKVKVKAEVEESEETRGLAPLPKEPAAAIINSFIRPFDLSIAPLIHVGLLKEENKHILMIDMHHIISDGISHAVLAKDFISLYAGEELPALRLHYKDFTHWQNNLIYSGEMRKQEQYWLKEFAGDIPELNLPLDYARQEMQSFEGTDIGFEISSNETTVLRDLSKKENATLFIVLLAIYNVLLSKLSGQEDIIVGTGTAGRRHADLEKVIGMFVNTLALRNYPVEEKTFREFLLEVRDRTLQAFENQDYLFEELVEKVAKKRDLSRNPLFDTVFQVQNMGDEAVDSSIIEKFTLKLRPYGHEYNISKFDMFWGCTGTGERLQFFVNYRTKLFERETIERYISYFKEIVSEVTDNSEIKIKDILISLHLLRSQSYEDEMELGF